MFAFAFFVKIHLLSQVFLPMYPHILLWPGIRVFFFFIFFPCSIASSFFFHSLFQIEILLTVRRWGCIWFFYHIFLQLFTQHSSSSSSSSFLSFKVVFILFLSFFGNTRNGRHVRFQKFLSHLIPLYHCFLKAFFVSRFSLLPGSILRHLWCFFSFENHQCSWFYPFFDNRLCW